MPRLPRLRHPPQTAAQKANHLRKPGSGRLKGSRNKLSLTFCAALSDDFDQHGEEVIAKVRRYHPDTYLKIIASVIPKELEVKVRNPVDAWQEDRGVDDETMRKVFDMVLAEIQTERERRIKAGEVIEAVALPAPTPQSGARAHPGSI